MIYIAGPFRGKTSWEIEQNVRHAEEVSLKLWKQLKYNICPHTMTRHFQGECSDEVFLQGCLEILSRCDAIYLLKGWENSIGSVQEYELALSLGLEVYREE